MKWVKKDDCVVNLDQVFNFDLYIRDDNTKLVCSIDFASPMENVRFQYLEDDERCHSDYKAIIAFLQGDKTYLNLDEDDDEE